MKSVCEEIVQNQNVSNQNVDQEFRFSDDYLGIASSFLLDVDDDQEIQMADQIESVTVSVDHNETGTNEVPTHPVQSSIVRAWIGGGGTAAEMR
ncbi:hypothetical protein EMCRGX_G018362 [Ephydatia muelleri]